MGRLEQILLTEKVSKKEMDEALSNQNVIIGAEFEFNMQEGYMYNGDYYSDLEDYESYEAEREKWKQDRDDYYDKQNEWSDELDTWKEQTEAWDEYDKTVEEYNDIKEKYENDLVEYEKAMKSYKGPLFGDKELKKPVLPVEIHYEPDEPEFPRPDSDEPEEPESPDDPPKYPQYVQDNEDMYIVRRWGYASGNNEDREIYPPSRESNAIDAFNQYKDGDANMNFINRNWEVKEDGSLGSNGVEVVSPPLFLKTFLEVCPKMFDIINDCGSTDEDCGFHIGVSLKNVSNLKNDLDVVKLVLLTDEDYIWHFFKERKGNSYVGAERYAQSPREKLISGGVPTTRKFIDVDRLKSKYGAEKYYGINVSKLYENQPYIEFRFLGGPHYHTKWEEVKKIIAHYIYAISADCDPTFKRKEYLLKLNKLMFRADYVEKRKRMLKLEEIIERGGADHNWIIAYEKEYTELRKQIKDLESRFNFDNTDIERMKA